MQPYLAQLNLQAGLSDYSRMGDVAVIAICCVIFILLSTSYVVRSKSYRVFSAIVGWIVLAAIVNVGFNELLNRSDLVINNAYTIGILYLLRVLYHFLLFNVFFGFVLYAIVVANVEKRMGRIIAWIATLAFITIVGIDIAMTFSGHGFSINKETGVAQGGSNVFMIGYVVFIAFISVLLFRFRKLIYKRILWGIGLTMLLSVIIRFAQLFIGESSLTTMTFLLPALAMLYIVHVNPYDVSTGTLNIKSMEDMIKNLYSKNKQFIIMSLQLPDFVGEGKSLPETVKNQTRRFTVEYFRNGTLFQIGNGQIIMIAKKDSNPDYNDWMKTILNAFQEQYRLHQMPYKIVYGESAMGSIGEDEYLSLIDYIHKDIPDNTTHRINVTDISRFKENKYIIAQLEDIHRKGDLNDPRVLVYAQPVFNIETKRFDTAEALMRLSLERTGLVSPVVFIPIAEERGYIHTLTKIILNKTCRTIRELMNKDVEFNRISINVSMLELKDKNFCSEINNILYDNGVPGHKIAIELTESQSEEDFVIMKERIEVLHDEGIYFYLDDFGTGYSNMERILELPFDIIKFDRSMVIASGQDKRSEHIVEKLAKMFSDFKYSVLYEGVENNEDEDRCLSMSATYLQGFKYSKPIPIADLEGFLTKPN